MSLCVDLAVDGGRPFAMFDDDAMKEIINMAKKSQHDLTTISSETVKNSLKSQAAKKRQKLIDLLQNCIVNFSLDFATCQHRSFFGNIFIKNLFFNVCLHHFFTRT